MFRNPLIGIDESDGGRDPVRLARKLCGPDVHLTLARVHGANPLQGPAMTEALRGAQLRTAEATLRRASRLTGVSDTVSIGAVSPADGLGRLTAEHRNDLLVIGSSRHGQPGIVGVHEWLAQVLTRESCAVAIAPLGYAADLNPIRTIGVAYNDSAESRRALMVARRLSGERDARVVVFEAPEREGGRRRSFTDVAEDLAEFSAEVDLLVIGPRGAGAFKRLGHPSATLSLVHSATCPLLLVTHRTAVPWGDEYPENEEWTSKLPTMAEKVRSL